MKIRNLILISIAFVSIFTSCQKDTNTLESLEAAEIAKEIIPDETENLAKIENVKTFEKITKTTGKQFEKLVEPVTVRTKATQEATSRNGSGVILCDVVLATTTSGKSNRFTTGLYNAFSLEFPGSNRSGGDDMHGFYIPEPMVVSFELFNLSANMSSFLFKGSENCRDSYCSYTLTQLVAYSSTNSTREDNIPNVYLTPGFYIFVVDAPYGVASDYDLRFRCGGSDDGLTSSICTLFGEDGFEEYENGDLTEQSCHWSKWTADSDNDAIVQGTWNKYLKIKRQAYATSANQPDILLNVNDAAPIHHVNFKMWIPSNRSATFNLQKNLTVDNASNEIGAGFFFKPDGTGYVLVNGRSTYFSYTPDSWMRIYIDVHNQEDNVVGFYINDRLIADFPASWNMYGAYGSNQLEAINFFPHRTDGLFYLNDVSVLD